MGPIAFGSSHLFARPESMNNMIIRPGQQINPNHGGGYGRLNAFGNSLDYVPPEALIMGNGINSFSFEVENEGEFVKN